MNKTIPLTTEQANEAIKQRRADALKWWDSLSLIDRAKVINKHFSWMSHTNLDNQQIENIWRAEFNQLQS